MFRGIVSDNFEPFKNLRLELPPVSNKPEDLAEVHLLTGVNGTGKTRLLSVLSAILGNSNHVKKRFKRAADASFNVTNVTWDSKKDQAFKTWSKCSMGSSRMEWQNESGNLKQWAESVPAFAYSGNAYITDSTVSPMGQVTKPSRADCLSFNWPESSSQVLLQATTNLLFEAAVDSLNASPESNSHGRAARLVKSLESTLLEITGTKFQFKIEKFPQISLFIIWGNTKLAFDALPDGLRAIIGWLVHALVMLDVWLQGKGDPTDTEVVFLLDEIESHLHPAWQRKILPAFQRLFPRAQIFIATHSPFVIASLNHGWIHSLKMDADRKVTVEAPKAASMGDSYISVVEDIMGITEWFDPETEKLLAEFRQQRDAVYNSALSKEERNQAKEQARTLGLQIGQRSMELDFMMGKELNQLERQLAKAV